MHNKLILVIMICSLSTIFCSFGKEAHSIKEVIASNCNDEILARFKSTNLKSSSKKLAELDESFFKIIYYGEKIENMRWVIEERGGKGCVITLIGDVNGVREIGFSYYMDLDEERLYPDNENAKTMGLYGDVELYLAEK